MVSALTLISDLMLKAEMLWHKVVYFITRPKGGALTLDVLYARLTMRKARLRQLIELDAPEFLLLRERELIARALRDIKVRHGVIREVYSKRP